MLQKQDFTTLLVDLFDFIFLCRSMSHLRRTPPSKEALRHSGGDRRLWTSATVTLYLEVELSRERRPGTEQNTSVGLDTIPSRDSLWKGTPIWLPLGWVTGPAQERQGDTWIHFRFATELLIMGLIKVLQMQYFYTVIITLYSSVSLLVTSSVHGLVSLRVVSSTY